MTTWMLLLALLVAGPGAVQEADTLDKSIADLGDERASIRETALQTIIAAGPPAIPRLRPLKALRSPR